MRRMLITDVSGDFSTSFHHRHPCNATPSCAVTPTRAPLPSLPSPPSPPPPTRTSSASSARNMSSPWLPYSLLRVALEHVTMPSSSGTTTARTPGH